MFEPAPARGGERRSSALLVLLLGLALTALTHTRIQDADQEAARAAGDASAAQLGLLIQSLASGIQTDLTSTVSVALATDGDVEAYRARVEDGTGSERALIALHPEPRIVATGSGTTPTAPIAELLTEPEMVAELTSIADESAFRFILRDDGGERALLIAAGAGDGTRAFIEVRRFALATAGPMIVDLVDGIDEFAVYTSDRADPDRAILASRGDVPLTGDVSTSTVTVGTQTLLMETIPEVKQAPIPPLAVFVVGAFLSAAIAGLLFLAQRRGDRAEEALSRAQRADQARQEMEANLQRAQRMETVGQLAGGVAHDFNNLLAAISSTADLVADDLRAEGVETSLALEDLDEIQNAARRGAALTRRLLSFSRRDVETRETLDVNAVVRDLEPLLRRSVPEDVDLRFELHAGPLLVDGDAGEIEQVVLNLVVNARDARRGADHRIVVTTESSDDGVVLVVADNGSGMDASVQDRAFEPFFTTRQDEGGTGLGLSIVYGITSRMQGRVAIESVSDEGTSIRVELPRSPNEVTAVPAIVAASGSSTIRPERILLVEDEDAVRRATKRLLERAGHFVVDASDGIDAIAEVEDGFDPTMLLTDVVLPGLLDGPEVARRVQEMTPQARVIFASGHPRELISGQQLLDDGALFLAKPFTSDALLSAVATSVAADPTGARA